LPDSPEHGCAGRSISGSFAMFTSAVPFITIGLLILSNVFMTFAWYGHLKFKAEPLYLVILVSWGIAFFEYCFQVPANRIGYGYFNAAQLKTIQEIITLSVFVLFSVFYLGEAFHWKQGVGFAFIALGAFFIFTK
jgi:uncharacterized protein (DUF486 family)